MEEVPKFTVTDYSVMCLMLCVSSSIGIYFAWRDRRQQSTKTFLMGNRELGVFPVSMSLMASFQSATTVLGYPSEMYYKGTQFWVAIFGLAVSNVIAAELFLPVLYNLQLTSVNSVSTLRPLRFLPAPLYFLGPLFVLLVRPRPQHVIDTFPPNTYLSMFSSPSNISLYH
ncbi:hypothetical protein HPB48_002640 [Haemaphysalis longicornis]|uniref:Sodium-dependent multivitamin transporter n=1 Tax=Haemaphysalis longicornis TaxID=44386 RepID=A0A9J6FS31_HAELO|nr:hypothetical protein HPB48_002640 [Haemaphysalis longicornis]